MDDGPFLIDSSIDHASPILLGVVLIIAHFSSAPATTSYLIRAWTFSIEVIDLWRAQVKPFKNICFVKPFKNICLFRLWRVQWMNLSDVTSSMLSGVTASSHHETSCVCASSYTMTSYQTLIMTKRKAFPKIRRRTVAACCVVGRRTGSLSPN